MKRLIVYGVGYGLGFSIVGGLIAMSVLGAIGVGGHFLAVREPGLGNVLGFDPGDVAKRAPIPGAAAAVLFVVFVVMARRIGRSRRPLRPPAPG